LFKQLNYSRNIPSFASFNFFFFTRTIDTLELIITDMESWSRLSALGDEECDGAYDGDEIEGEEG